MSCCVFHNTAPATHDRQLFEIVEQAYIQRQNVVVFVGDDARATAIDRALWILKQDSFIPHKIFSAIEADPGVSVAIVTCEANPNSAGILVADGHCSLDFACSFEAIHEFVNRSSAELHEACRDRFKAYRQRQIPVEYIQA
jgi:DNA polymerase III subunit chi